MRARWRAPSAARCSSARMQDRHRVRDPHNERDGSRQVLTDRARAQDAERRRRSAQGRCTLPRRRNLALRRHRVAARCTARTRADRAAAGRAPWHGWRYIAFGPDDKLSVGIGAPCNVCDRDREGFGQILRMNPDGSGREVVARGVRNTVGFTWHPDTHELWFTDNGRDMLGDDVPPCELNRLSARRRALRFSVLSRGRRRRPGVRQARSLRRRRRPRCRRSAPHVAPLGVRFYAGAAVPGRMAQPGVHCRTRFLESQ